MADPVSFFADVPPEATATAAELESAFDSAWTEAADRMCPRPLSPESRLLSAVEAYRQHDAAVREAVRVLRIVVPGSELNDRLLATWEAGGGDDPPPGDCPACGAAQPTSEVADLPEVLALPPEPEVGVTVASDDAVHEWFGLSYSNYAVLPRTLMQSMPAAWQRRMVACLDEMRDAFAHVPQASGYKVEACCWVAPVDMGADELRAAGLTAEYAAADGEPSYTDASGNEVHALDTQALPATDPVPYYDRGRARIEPSGVRVVPPAEVGEVP